MMHEIDDSRTESILKGSGVPRTRDKVHVTDIIRYIDKQIGRNQYAPGNTFGAPGLTMEMGFLWEDLLSHVFAGRLGARVVEMEEDGIVMSPDGVGFDDVWGCPVVEEYKCTWKSSRNDPTDNTSWMTQTQAYCYAFGITTVLFRILYVMGDYKGSGPLYRECRVRFTADEVLSNWEMLVNNRDAAWADMKGGASDD